MTYLQRTAITGFLALALPSSLLAQEGSDNAWGGRAFATFNVGGQTASPGFGYEYVAPLFEQSAKAGFDIPGKSGLTFDVGAGVRVVQNLGIGVTYSRYSNQRTATLSTTIPNPLNGYYDVPNDASTIEQQMPMQREEHAVHIQAIYRVSIGRRIQVGGFGGPTYFRCIDDHVTKFALEGDISPDLAFSVAFLDTWQLVNRDSAWGYHAGGNFTYLATKHVGVGMTVRYSQASHTTMNHLSDTTNLEDEGIWGGDNGTVSVTMKHGGVQWNGGVSFHF